jgi:hypothetical protein
MCQNQEFFQIVNIAQQYGLDRYNRRQAFRAIRLGPLQRLLGRMKLMLESAALAATR